MTGLRFFGRTTLTNIRKIQRSLLCRSGIVSARSTIRESAQISRIFRVESALEHGRIAIRNRLATKSNRRDEQRSTEEASKDEDIFESNALIVESAVRKVAQEFFVRSSLSLRTWETCVRSGCEVVGVADEGMKERILDVGMLWRDRLNYAVCQQRVRGRHRFLGKLEPPRHGKETVRGPETGKSRKHQGHEEKSEPLLLGYESG